LNKELPGLGGEHQTLWLMLDTSGELFMMMQMQDTGSKTGCCFPHSFLSMAASTIFLSSGTLPCFFSGILYHEY
jgi:hypothetical protein